MTKSTDNTSTGLPLANVMTVSAAGQTAPLGEQASAQQTAQTDASEKQSAKKQAKQKKQKAANDSALYEFLPAAIEVENTPASPAGLAIIWAIMIFFTIAVIWAFFGKIDIVAVATGKIIPSEHIKQIQALEAGKITHIHIREGQNVKQGDALITLDNTQTQADVFRLQHELQERQATALRLQTFEGWVAGLSEQDYRIVMPLPIAIPKDIPKANSPLIHADATLDELAAKLSQSQLNLLNQQKAELTARISTLHSEQAKQHAEQAMTQAEITKKQRVLPVLKERVDAYDILRQKEYGSKLQYLEYKQYLIEQEQDLYVHQARLKQQQASIQSLQNQVESLVSEQWKNNLNQLQETQLQIAGLQQELIKATQRNQQLKLTSPITGQVQQLAVHTIGGVVTPAQPLMVIVPEQSQLEVEAMILNRDIGFVHEGQKSEVKIDTFNFTKYGLIDAEITTISDDAIQDENFGLVYIARIKLHQDELQIGDKWVKLSPGMSVTAEVKTGKRRLIEYFLSPLLRYKQESLGER
jgi:hemolysin D